MPSLPVLPSTPHQSSDVGALARELTAQVEGEVRLGRHDRLLYATDASLYQVEPLAVVIPSSTDDAARAVRFCARHNLPVLPRGGGTSLAGQCTNRAVVIDFSPRCRRILDVDPARRTVRVEPGITLDDLNDALAPTGLFFAPDPATSRHANVGGCIGNNAAGARSIRYGRTSENLESVRALLATGEAIECSPGHPSVRALARRIAPILVDHARFIDERFPKTLRRNAGYQLDVLLAQLRAGGLDPAALHLAPLLCGSEGTLAVTLDATLTLHPRPKAKALATIGFSDLDAALDAVLPILSTRPTAVELLDDTIVTLALANAEYRAYAEMMPRPADGRPLKAVLYVEYFADSEGEAHAGVAALQKAVPHAAIHAHHDAPAQLRAWKLRKAGEPLLHGIPGRRKPITFVEDNAVPVENLAVFIKEFRAMVASHGTTAAYYAHASVGVLHIRPLIDIHSDADRAVMRSIARHAADLAKSLGGVMSGEHGDGRVRTPFLERYFGPELMHAFREVKRLFDPRNLLNPGNIVDLSGDHPRPIDSITQNLRVEPGGRPAVIPPGVDTFYSYDDQHGLDGAVEMCNGSGVCRKKQGGTMCPSYMATLDERHSTRGRGNALRLAITGQVENPGELWSDPATIETLDLCLSCKACKTECPSNVDIARLKSEYTAQRYAREGAPLAVRLMGEIRALNALASLAPKLANASQPLVRKLLGRVAGIDPRRSLPHAARSLASLWREPPADEGPVVVLFGDCFTMYNEPGIGLATRRVLEAFGYRVRLANAGCCARAKISLGLLQGAVAEIDATFAALWPIAKDPGVAAILVAEPSCLSAIKDDWLTLKTQAPLDAKRSLAAKCFLPEEFLERAWGSHPRRPEFRAAGGVTLHAHCHQKALWGAESSAAILRRVFGGALRVPDTGCCGMAGAFGYTRHRFDLSMTIGELSVFPAVRATPGADRVVAPGTSCRHQIKDATARTALHPIEILAECLTERRA
jgi:FAD/FMN-containing dehydrogenase/Fe-S oxidoreductase